MKIKYLEDIKFYKTEFENELLLSRIYSNSSLLNIFRSKKILNDSVNKDINLRLKGDIDNFVTILIVGEQGSIKSSVGQQLALRTDENFKSDNISLFYEDFRHKISISKAGQTFILDELVFIHGIGSHRILNEIQTTIETLRKRKNSMIVIAVEEKYFPENIFTFVLETIDKCLLGTCEAKPKLHEIRKCPSIKHNIKKAYVRLAVKKKNVYLGFYIQEIIWNDNVWKGYETLKEAFLKKVITQDFVKLNFTEEAKKIRLMPEANNYQTIKQIKLFLEKHRPNLTVIEKELLAEEIRLQREK